MSDYIVICAGLHILRDRYNAEAARVGSENKALRKWKKTRTFTRLHDSQRSRQTRAVFTIHNTGTSAYTFDVTTAGSGYDSNTATGGDKIVIKGSDLGGVDGTNDCTLTVTGAAGVTALSAANVVASGTPVTRGGAEPVVRPIPMPLALMNATTEYSGAALEEKKLWVTLTATLEHANWKHLINNMLHLAHMVPALRAHLSRTQTGAAFFTTGIAGWLTTYALNRWEKERDGEWAGPEGYHKFVSGVGASPATYGLNVLLATLAPNAACSTLGLPSWLSLWLLYCSPEMLSAQRNGHRVGWRADEGSSGCGFIGIPWLSRRWAMYTALTAAIARLVVGSDRTHVTALSLWKLYLLKTMVWKFAGCTHLGSPFLSTRSDNGSHLGGALLGLLLGLALRRGNSSSSLLVPAGSLAGTLSYLGARFVGNF
jgi:membrane associated rhomboid family serine protease